MYLGKMCLVLGPSGAGKTLLLRRLHSFYDEIKESKLEIATSIVPTVGTELVNISAGKRHEVVMREVGGCMAPIWQSYFKKCTALIFMVDLANRFQISASCMQLLTILSHPHFVCQKILILLNKIDLASCMSRFEFESLLRLDELRKQSQLQISVLEASAQEKTGLSLILRWIEENADKVSS